LLERRTAEGEAATQVVLSTFRVNGLLLAAGDLLSGVVGLTSARWQVLGAVALADGPLTVPQIARRMGLTRQSVHASVNRLVDEGLLELSPNTEHRRSRLVRLTELGRTRYAAVDERQTAWVNRLADGIDCRDLDTTARVLEDLARRLELDAASDATKEEK
jgi:DNA-binding MarR family transcriptional regulator